MTQSAKAHTLEHASDDAVRRPGDGATVRDIMSPVVVSLKADADLETAGSLLLNFQLDALPVVDDEGRPIGRLAMHDLLREVVESADWQPTMRVAQVMNRDLELVPASASIVQAAAGMASAPTSTAVVVSSAGKLVGMVSAADVLAWLASCSGYPRTFDRGLLRLPVGVP